MHFDERVTKQREQGCRTAESVSVLESSLTASIFMVEWAEQDTSMKADGKPILLTLKVQAIDIYGRVKPMLWVP
jgi:hypothetical protein